MGEIVIGKHTLESLTSGMYSDPYVVFREYIQNSVDSIDEAVRIGVLSVGMGKIVVSLSPTESQIVISDNGLGIRAMDAESTLISIGNSRKTSENSRGFRGIGRLSALSYCNRLIFKTSFKGENVGTEVIIDAKKMSEILAEDSIDDVTITDVLESVYSISSFCEQEDIHYFSVKIEGVDINSRLLSYTDVENYLMQNAPVPYNPDFVWGDEIVKRLQNEGLTINSYNILLEYGTHSTTIYKPYTDEFIVDKSKGITDFVQDVQITKIPDNQEKMIAIGWLAKTNYKGSIYDKAIKGIRMRKGNILIGDYQTLNVAFKEARFNGWTMGEIFVIDKLLIPNARRDNFEKNSVYFSLFESLMTITAAITRDIRTASLQRNSSLSKAMDQLQQTAQQATSAIDNGVSSVQKGKITRKLKETQNSVANSVINGDSEQYYQDVAFAELDMLIGKLKGTTQFKALNTINSLTNTEKRIIERVICIIESLELDNADDIIEAIIDGFSS